MTRRTADWFADEEFWVATYPLMFPDSRFEAANVEVDHLLALTRCTEGKVLDLACGPGRHSVPLAQRGFAVTGVDRSAFLLGRARARAAELGLAIEWVQGDMRELRRPDGFDLALSLFTSFGYFEDDAENQRVLENVAIGLRPGGALVLDMLGKEVLARTFQSTTSHEMPAGLVVQRHQIVDDWKRIENEWILLEDGGTRRTFRFSHWLYSAREIEGMFRHAGFKEIALHGDLLGAPYGTNAGRLVVMGRK